MKATIDRLWLNSPNRVILYGEGLNRAQADEGSYLELDQFCLPLGYSLWVDNNWCGIFSTIDFSLMVLDLFGCLSFRFLGIRTCSDQKYG
jgi:hypothetical protein